MDAALHLGAEPRSGQAREVRASSLTLLSLGGVGVLREFVLNMTRLFEKATKASSSRVALFVPRKPESYSASGTKGIRFVGRGRLSIKSIFKKVIHDAYRLPDFIYSDLCIYSYIHYVPGIALDRWWGNRND